MPTITGANATEWKMREMARRAGKKYETEPVNPYAKTLLNKQKQKLTNNF